MHERTDILVVDDDERHAQSVSALLSAEGYQVDYVTQGTQVLERVADTAVDVLILDLNIPDLSGIDILHALSECEQPPKTIVLSGATELDDVTPILRLGARDYLPKPYQPGQLIAAVRNAMSQVELERQNAAMSAKAAAQAELHGFLVNASPDLIYMLDTEGNFSYLNDRLGDLFDYRAEDLHGRSWHNLVSADIAETLEFKLNERRTGPRATRLEFAYADPGGVSRVIELSAMGLYQQTPAAAKGFIGTYGVIRDVTELRRTSRALAESQERFYGLFMTSPDAVFISRVSDGAIIESNDNFQKMINSIGVAFANDDTAIWPRASDREAFVAALFASPERHDVTFERTVDGVIRHFEITAKLVDTDRDPCCLATIRDRTAEKRAEHDRLKLESQLQQAVKMEAIGQLAGGIAHDFNNILASMIGYAELVQVAAERIDTDQVRGYLDEVIIAGQRARDLISQMLTFTRARRGNLVRLDIRESIDGVSRMLRAAIPASIEIDTHVDDDLPMVLIDPVQLQQIVLNLMINARDAIQGTGRIVVEVGLRNTEGRCASCLETVSGRHVVLSISDTGHGIRDDVLPRIFDMYYTTHSPGEGTGFGLWLIHTLMHEYGGHIFATTRVDQGTTFEMLFPDADSMVDLEIDDQPQMPSGRILVVDDEMSVSGFIGEVLKNAGYEVVVYNDSMEALKYVQDNLDSLSLIITDQAMPHVSGLEIAEHAKQRRGELPIVLITGYPDKHVSGSVKHLGIERFLKKPFRIDDLLLAVRELAHIDAAA